MYGLKSSEVEKQREKYGSNKLPEPKMKTWFEFTKEALSGRVMVLLIVLTALHIVFGLLGVGELISPIITLCVIALCTIVNAKGNLGNQKSAMNLYRKTSVRYCDVIRDGKIQTINRNDLVVGDCVLLRTGQEVYADGFIVEGKLTVNNAALNGEPEDVKKYVTENFVYNSELKKNTSVACLEPEYILAGSVIMSGEAKMIVTDVGLNTANGETIVKMQTLEAPETAFTIAVDKLCASISTFGSIAAVLIIIVSLITGIAQVGSVAEYFSIDKGVMQLIYKLADIFSLALTVIVAAVPEGLPVIVEILTRQNVKIMEKFNILAKIPKKVPELAYTDIICTDKTGTLTTGKMIPKSIISGDLEEIIGKDSALNDFIKFNICMNNSASFDAHGNIIGENFIDRAALSLLSADEANKIQDNFEIIQKETFSSEKKYSAISVLATGETDHGAKRSFYKGAPEKIISSCDYYASELGETKEFTSEKKKAITNKIKEMNTKAMRCIALAQKSGELTEGNLPDKMTFLGVIGVIDPIRPEVPSAVATAHQSGIQVIEITGDCYETALAVAKEAGIYNDGDLAIKDEDFQKMSDDEVKEIIHRLRVISRCSPNTKLRLVTLAQEIGKSVAMTGDGVNDSPALKQADVGFGMQDGSDVAKEAADIVLTDNNFASIVKGVELGRTFLHNIMMFLEFQLPINFVLLIFCAIYPVVADNAEFLAPVQILIINIIMDSLNSLSFGGEPPKSEYMLEKPVKKGSGLFIRGSKARIAITTLTFSAIYCSFIFGPISQYFTTDIEKDAARFALLCFMAVFNGLNIRTESLNLFTGLNKNKAFVGIGLGILLMAVLLCNVVGGYVGATALTLTQWNYIIGLALLVIPVDLIRKAICKIKK